MAVAWNATRGVACLMLVLGACAREELVATGGCDDFAPGDVVITEVHANPDGSDGDGEYVELFNGSGIPLTLDGLTLVSSRSDGTGAKEHRFFGTWVGAGDYWIAGNVPRDSMPPHIDYSYGDTLGSLRNSNARISIRCGEQIIDQVSYESTADGRALELDGRFAPDHELNDEASRWCTTPEGVDEVSPGNFGTPGTANSPCAFDEPEGGCLESGVRRAVRVPNPGEVQFREWMANPAGADADLEWVEVLFSAEADLNGFQLGAAPDALVTVVEQDACFPVGAGERVVFGASPAAASRVDAELGFSLGNSGERSVVAVLNGIVLDQVDYDGTVEGRAWQLDPNDELCVTPTQDEYISGNFGTPGESNPICPLVLGPGMCVDEGAPREIVSPSPGDAWITEWMANPLEVGNRDGEWLEVRFDRAVDLNGLVLSDLSSSTDAIEAEGCLEVAAGAHVLFARNTNPIENGGLERVDLELSLSLNNSDETIALSIGNQALDSVSYERSKAGIATQVDVLGNVCDAAQAYGDGDLGTPGAPNPLCP
ncbi:MAG: lamin tail domain-containing protein [Myxococcales bacterium]|nr:lamin tail domain-containing protein [Myxococcales bacterium]